MRRPDVAPYLWTDPTEPLTVTNSGGRRSIVAVRTADGDELLGFAVRYDTDARELTVYWSNLLCTFDSLTDTQHPVAAPAGPLHVGVITPA